MHEEEVDRGSERGEMDAGLQIDTGALLLEMAGTEVLAGGVNWPLVPLSELTSLAGELFFFAGLTLFWPPFCCCCCCWRHLARRFLNHTWKTNQEGGERRAKGVSYVDHSKDKWDENNYHRGEQTALRRIWCFPEEYLISHSSFKQTFSGV